MLMKRFFTLCAVTIALLLCGVTVSARTLGTGGYGDLMWIMSDDGELVITGSGEMLSADSYSEYPWHEYRSQIESIVIGNGVTSIGEGAFRDCSSLTSITIPESVTSIGSSAFSSCNSLTSITIPEGVTSIGDYAFYYCTGLTSITIPESVTSIGYQTFYYCTGLTSITIPESVTSIGGGAFEDCYSLTAILVDANNEVYDSRNDCNAIIETSSNTLIAGCMTTVIPESVTSIGDYAFSGCSGLTSINIPESVTSIEYYAFSGCTGLTSITIPESVTSIGSRAFSGCSGLTSINIPESVTSIGDWAFSGCSSLTSILVDANNEVYDSRNDCNAIIETSSNTLIAGCMTTVIPESVTSIGNWAFSGCSGLTSINIPESVTSIGDDAFLHTAWYNQQPDGVVYLDGWVLGYKGGMPENTAIVIDNGVKGIAVNAFSNCSGLTSITIPKGVTSIGHGAFYYCTGLTSITMPEGVTSIGDWAFERCTGLTSITIPESVTSIGYQAFYNCSSLTDIYCLTVDPFSIIPGTFGGVDKSSCVLGVPAGSVDAYCNAEYWKSFENIVPLHQVTYVLDDEVVETCWQPEGATIVIPNMEKEGYSLSDWTMHTPIDIKGRIKDMTNPQDEVLYTNAHCTNTQYGDQFASWEVLFDGKADSFFHSEYSDNESLDGEHHYLRVDAGKPISEFNFTFTTRSTNSWINSPTEMVVEGCDLPNGEYEEIAVLTGLPTTDATIYNSEVLGNGKAYRYIRYRVTKTASNYNVKGHPYFFLAEFGMSDYSHSPVTENFVMPASDVVLTATNSINSYRVTFSHGNGIVSSEELHYGATIIAPEAPERKHYTFVEWSEYPATVPAHDVEVVAKYALALDESEVTDFYKSADEEVARITYTRTFDDTEWQTLYVPFEISVDEAFLEDFEIADLNDIRQYDYDNDGVKDETVLEAFKVTSGVLEANYPYLIRAKEQGKKVIAIEEEAMVYATEENSIDCSSVREKYTFTGNYGGIGSGWPVDEGYYTLVGGAWQPVSEGTELGAFRFYLKVDSRHGNSATFARSIRLRIVGKDSNDDEVTGIEMTTDNGQQTTVIYDLSGRRVLNPTKGIYIVNGCKVVIK